MNKAKITILILIIALILDTGYWIRHPRSGCILPDHKKYFRK